MRPQLGGPPYLYSSLGTVTEGLDVVEKLGSLYNPDQDPSDPSTQTTAVPLYINKVEIVERARAVTARSRAVAGAAAASVTGSPPRSSRVGSSLR